jgi:class 3 adenylate cyclase
VRSYQQVCDAVVGRLHGNVAQYLGDGLLVHFGYPVAREDDPRRSLSAFPLAKSLHQGPISAGTQR